MFDTILKNKWIPVIFQILTFFVFIFLIIIGWRVTSSDNTFILTLRNTNLANLVIWCFWWPGIIIISILFGRIWCTVCPMELIASLFNRIGLNLKNPKFLRSGWAITFLYGAVLIIGVHTLAIHRIPHRMALFMIFLLGLTVILSLIFEKRAFCTFFCPVGHLLGLYSTNAVMEWRTNQKEVCDNCKEKPCVNKNRDNAWYGRACQSYLFPGSLKDNRDCILCTQCIKACPYNNITFRFRKPFKDLFKGFKLSTPQIFFILIVFGFAFYEVVTEWKTAKTWLMTPFNYINDYFSISPPWNGTVTALLLFFVLPLVLFIAVSLMHSIICSKQGLSSLKFYLLAFTPLIASTHFAKSVVKPVSRFQYIPFALKNPAGIETANNILAGTVHIGGHWQNNINIISIIIAILILITGIMLTLSLIIRVAGKNKDRFPVFYILISAIYFICTAGSLACKIFL